MIRWKQKARDKSWQSAASYRLLSIDRMIDEHDYGYHCSLPLSPAVHALTGTIHNPELVRPTPVSAFEVLDWAERAVWNLNLGF